MSAEIFVIAFAFVIFTSIFLFAALRRRKLVKRKKKIIREMWLGVQNIADPAQKILEADKVFDYTLKAAGYEGSVGDMLKKASPRFTQLDDVWRAHKLRNRLAHEVGAVVSKVEAERAMKAFERALKDLGL